MDAILNEIGVNMKTFIYGLLLFALLLVVSCAATPVKRISEPLTYNEVVEVDNMSKDALFTKANMWFVDAFRNADSVIQFSEKDSGVIKGKYVGDKTRFADDSFRAAGTYLLQVTSTITVEVREGRYRISFDNPTYQVFRDTGYPLEGTARIGETGAVTQQALADLLLPEWKRLANNLKISIKTESSDW